MNTTEKGVAFVAAHEGFVSRAYRDPGGVLTIGYGFTGLSTVFSAYWRSTKGHPLRSGDTIDRATADKILAHLLAAEYEPPVERKFPRAAAHQFDGAVSVVFNCGARTLKDKWATALAAGNVALAATLLRGTRVTAGGKRLAGLVRRRADEARLIETGSYGNLSPGASSSTSAEAIRAYQAQLAVLGLYKGLVDGIRGRQTIEAILAFQRSQPDLVVDGNVGPATRAALTRAVEAKRGIAATATGGAASGVGAGVVASGPPASDVPAVDVTTLPDAIWTGAITAAIAVAVIALGFVLWRNRGRILGRRTPA